MQMSREEAWGRHARSRPCLLRTPPHVLLLDVRLGSLDGRGGGACVCVSVCVCVVVAVERQGSAHHALPPTRVQGWPPLGVIVPQRAHLLAECTVRAEAVGHAAASMHGRAEGQQRGEEGGGGEGEEAQAR